MVDLFQSGQINRFVWDGLCHIDIVGVCQSLHSFVLLAPACKSKYSSSTTVVRDTVYSSDATLPIEDLQISSSERSHICNLLSLSLSRQ